MPVRRIAVLALFLTVVRTVAGAPAVPAPAPAPAPAVVRLAADVAVRLATDDARLSVGVWMNENEFREALNENGTPVDSNITHEFRIIQHGGVLATGRASLKVLNRICDFVADFTAHRHLDARGFGYRLSLYGERHGGKAWKADDATDKLPPKVGKHTLKKGKTRKFSIESGGQTWTLAFPFEMEYVIRDRRAWGEEDFEVSFVPQGDLKLGIRASAGATCTITATPGVVRAEARAPVRLAPGKDWSPLVWSGEAKPSSAQDFTRYSHKPVQGRQYGVRLTGGQVLQDVNKAAIAARQFVRAGMNSVELADFAGRLRAPNVAVPFDRDALLLFDGFVRTMKKEGLSVVCDYRDPRPGSWMRLGVSVPEGRKREEPVSASLTSALAAFSDSAHEEWKTSVSAFYSHKPPKSIRRFGEEAALSGVCLGSGLFGAWHELRTVPEVAKAYSDWLQEKRKGNPDFMKGAVCEPLDLKLFSIGEGRCGSVRCFLAEREAELMKKRRQCLRELKVKAKTIAAPGSVDFRDVAPVRGEEGEILVTSFSVDSPWPQGEGGRHPHFIRNVNPFRSGEPVSESLGWHRTEGHGLGILSWSAPAPSAWRAGIGLYVGAKAAKEEWSVLFRADTSDPMAWLFDRVIVPLYLRGDFTAGDPASELKLADGGFTVSTPRTCGGFSPLPSGTVSAGCLEAKLGAAAAAIWISSLSPRPIGTSKRLLLTHVTDIQRNGATFPDSRRKQLLAANGTGFVMRNGTAAVRLRGIEKPRSCHVVPLKTDGTRLKQLNTRVEGADLLFDIAVAGEAGAQTTYEIFKD